MNRAELLLSWPVASHSCAFDNSIQQLRKMFVLTDWLTITISYCQPLKTHRRVNKHFWL
jgi:hypothetical protein